MKPNEFDRTDIFASAQELFRERGRTVPKVLSIAGHVVLVSAALIPWSTAAKAPRLTTTEVVLYTPELQLTLPPAPEKPSGGGGGGTHQPTPASFGQLPRAADKQFTPPTPEVKNMAPLLIAEATIVAPTLANLPPISSLQIGDPDGILGPPSSGNGNGGGIGDGDGTGIGPGRGPGVGPGEGGDFGGGRRRPGRVGVSAGGGYTMPVPVYSPEPKYSEDARKVRFQGTVTVAAIVRKDGGVEIVGVVRSPGYGLDQEAIKTLSQWRFKPGTRNGQPVDIELQIEVNFRLL
jgi:TonB family protein